MLLSRYGFFVTATTTLNHLSDVKSSSSEYTRYNFRLVRDVIEWVKEWYKTRRRRGGSDKIIG